MPQWVSLPVDLTLGVLFPVHSHIALNYVISDYVPKAIRTTARVGLFGATTDSSRNSQAQHRGAGLDQDPHVPVEETREEEESSNRTSLGAKQTISTKKHGKTTLVVLVVYLSLTTLLNSDTTAR